MNVTLAIANAEGSAVLPHLARSTCFVVLNIEDGHVTARSERPRGADQCGDHRTFVEMLEGCQAVICGAIGQGAADSLEAHGIKPMVVARPMSMEEALQHYLAGTLPTTGERECLCG